MTTLQAALTQARAYWEAKGPSSRMMPIRAQACASALGYNAAKKLQVEALTPSHATTILTHLHRHKGRGSVPVYYAAFKRVVELAGGDTRGWPKAGSAPRRCREPISERDLDRLDRMFTPRWVSAWQSQDDCSRKGVETKYLLELLRGTGMRVEAEALKADAWRWEPESRVLRITGKGGHERVIPVERPETIELLNNPAKLRTMRRTSYSGHLKRWQQAIERLGITTLKPTPHAVRHYYATRAYERSGRNLRLVQELLGHADIATTARYLGVDVEEMREAVR